MTMTIRLTTFVGLIFILQLFLQKRLTTFTTFKISCKTGRSGNSTRQKKFIFERFFRVKMKITGKIWEFRGCASRPGGCDITNSYTVGPLMTASGAFTVTLVYLYQEARKRPAQPLRASERF